MGMPSAARRETDKTITTEKNVTVYLNAKLYDLVKASPSAIIQQALKEYEKKQGEPENE